MPAYNAASTLTQSVESVLAQTYPCWELIIIDDGSKDNTAELALACEQRDERIKFVRLEKNGGLSNARNTAGSMATGDFIAFLDSDDIWLSDKLEKQIAYHKKYPNVLISHTGFENFTGETILHKNWANRFVEYFYKKQGSLLPQLLYKNTIGVLTVMVRKDVFLEAGKFDVNLWGLEDQDLWIRLARRGVHFGYLPQVLARYRINPHGMMSNVGKYKRAYKSLLKKYSPASKIDPVSRTSWGMYYRYFGSVYYRKNNFKLSALYFGKSLSWYNSFLINITSLVYLISIYNPFNRKQR